MGLFLLHKKLKKANTKNMKNYYKESIKEFIKFIKKTPYCTKNEWDEYAHEHCLFSAFTLYSHADVDTFEELKRKLRRLFL